MAVMEQGPHQNFSHRGRFINKIHMIINNSNEGVTTLTKSCISQIRS